MATWHKIGRKYVHLRIEEGRRLVGHYRCLRQPLIKSTATLRGRRCYSCGRLCKKWLLLIGSEKLFATESLGNNIENQDNESDNRHDPEKIYMRLYGSIYGQISNQTSGSSYKNCFCTIFFHWSPYVIDRITNV